MRNESAIILHATFEVLGRKTRYLMVGDSTWEVLEEIVDITRDKGNDKRLWWDLDNVPHHCSYLALGPDKGEERTEPVDPTFNGCWINVSAAASPCRRRNRFRRRTPTTRRTVKRRRPTGRRLHGQRWQEVRCDHGAPE